MKNILLVNPHCKPPRPSSKLSLRSLADKWGGLDGTIPLGLATIAALTPDNVDVEIWDEGVDGPITPNTKFKQKYDLVGVTGYRNHAQRAKALGHIFRAQGSLTVIGGPGVSAEPELFQDSFDIRFIGEAEYTWPRFLADWEAGNHRSEYRQVSKVDMLHSPPPKWDKLPLKSYLMGAVQTTRGCPFDCEFCDVIYLFGRQARHKSIDQVVSEVCELERRGVRRALFCDDNFIGNPHYAKQLLKELKRLNQSFRDPVSFLAQVSLNVAKDDEFLELMADACFLGAFIGIESPNIESLVEANKKQNYRTDIAADVMKIQSYGLVIQSGMIVGFDHDDASIFDRHFEFYQKTGLMIPTIHLLKAATGTPLWVRLLKEGRVLRLPEPDQATNLECFTNIIPKQLTIPELLSGYISLVERVRDWRHFEARARTVISQIRPRPRIKHRVRWKAILTALLPLAWMDGEARGSTIRLLLYAWRRAPFMVEAILSICWIQYLEAARIPGLRKSVDDRIRQLPANGLDGEREAAAFVVPDAFRKPYKEVFTKLHERVYGGLGDKSRTDDALIDVTRDFITRWGPSFQHFEDHHLVFLEELCDRSIASENSVSNRPSGNGGGPGRPDIGAGRLSDEVLRCVEQELRSVPAG